MTLLIDWMIFREITVVAGGMACIGNAFGSKAIKLLQKNYRNSPMLLKVAEFPKLA